MTKSAKSSRDARLKGSQEPSVRIAPRYSKSDGFDAVKIIKAGGIVLDPWQADVLDDWMALNASGRWAAPTCGLSVPRQNGKSLLVQSRSGSGMLMYGETVIYTAHLQKTATETFEEMRAYFESPKLISRVAEIRSALGREQIILKNGAKIKFLARTRNGGRGQHGDLLIFDEAQELDDNQQASFLPAISASINPQTIYLGTPPDPAAVGTVFRGIREKAINGKTKKVAWTEYSVKEIGDVRDESRWIATNPAIGRRILLTTIDTECEQMDADTFARERLGWWAPVIVQKEEMAIQPKVWQACRSDELKPEGKTAYGVKFSADGSEVCLCGAVIPKEGKARISLIERKSTSEGVRWLAEWLNERYKQASCVVVDGRNGVDVLIERISDTWKYKGSVIRPSARDVVAAVSLLTTELHEKTVTWYTKQEALAESALTATKRAIGGGWGFGGENSSPIEAASLALWGCRNSKRDPNRKMKVGC